MITVTICCDRLYELPASDQPARSQLSSSPFSYSCSPSFRNLIISGVLTCLNALPILSSSLRGFSWRVDKDATPKPASGSKSMPTIS